MKLTRKYYNNDKMVSQLFCTSSENTKKTDLFVCGIHTENNKRAKEWRELKELLVNIEEEYRSQPKIVYLDINEEVTSSLFKKFKAHQEKHNWRVV